MSEEKELRNQVKSAEEAEKCIKFFENAANDVKKRNNDAIIKSSYDDKAGREEAYHMIRAIDAVMAQVKEHVKVGRKAQSKLDKLIEKTKKKLNL